MKKKYWLLIFLGLIMILPVPLFAGCSGWAGSTSNGTQVQVDQQPEGFWVSGSGEVTVTPNLATVSLGIQSQDKNVADAQAEAVDGMNKVMQSLTDAGIAKKDIQTGSFSINQRTRWNDYDQTQTIVGYQVNNMVTVKIHDVNNVGNVIDSAVQAGGDLIRINGILFSVEDPSPYYQQAREKAITNAKDKAEQYAKLMGVHLGNPTYVVEGSQSPNYYGNYWGGGIAIPAPTIAYSLSDGTSISPGENKITVNVTVSYEMVK